MKICNPNKEVECWKDAVYEETKGMSKKELDWYFQRQMEEDILKCKKKDVFKKKVVGVCCV